MIRLAPTGKKQRRIFFCSALSSIFPKDSPHVIALASRIVAFVPSQEVLSIVSFVTAGGGDGCWILDLPAPLPQIRRLCTILPLGGSNQGPSRLLESCSRSIDSEALNFQGLFSLCGCAMLFNLAAHIYVHMHMYSTQPS